MFGNFTYCNPTKLYFGEEDVEKIADLVIPMNGGYKRLNHDETVKILKNSI